MQITLDYTVTGVESILRELDQVQERISNSAPFWRSPSGPSDVLTSALERIFEQEGPGWAELSPYTIMVRRWPEKPILEQTGALKRAVIYDPEEVITPRSYLRRVANPLVRSYAIRHELGDPDNNLPDRPFWAPAFRSSIGEIVSDHRTYILTGRL